MSTSTPSDRPAQSERVVRASINSTSRGMHAERGHLVTVVLPELRARAEQLGLEFFNVELGRGVPARDLNGETANSWEYCRPLIDRVEPLFVCILGSAMSGCWSHSRSAMKPTAKCTPRSRSPRWRPSTLCSAVRVMDGTAP